MLLTIDSAANLPAPAAWLTGTIWLELEFIIKISANTDLYLDGVKWAKTTARVRTANRIEFRHASTGVALWYLDYPRVSDSNHQEYFGQFELRRQGGTYYITVRVPHTWVQTAQFPIYIDPTIEPQVGASAQDGKWGTMWGGEDFNETDSEVWVGNRISGTREDYNIFARFTNVTVPAGATIDVAYVQLRGAETDSTSGWACIIRMVDADNPAAPTTYADCTGFARTTTNTTWSNASVTINTWINTPSIVGAVQEVVDRAGWATNQAMIALLEDNGCSDGVYRNFNSYDTSSSYAPILHIEYSTSSPVTVSLSAASLAAAAQTATVLPGAATVSLAAATCTVSPQSTSIGAGAVAVLLGEVALAAAPGLTSIGAGAVAVVLAASAVTAAPQNITIDAPAPEPVTIPLNVAGLVATPQTVSVVPGAVSVSLSTAGVVTGAQSITVDAPAPGAVTVSLGVATITSAAQATTVVPGAVIVALSVASIVASPQSSAIVPGAVTLSLSAAGVSAQAQTVTSVPGAVSVVLTAATITTAPQSVTVSSITGLVVQLNSATLVAQAQSGTVAPGAVSVSVNASAISAGAQGVTVSAPPPEAVVVTLQAASLSVTPQVAAVVPGAVAAQLQVATVVASPQAVTISAFANIVVPLASATLVASPQTALVVPGAVIQALQTVALVAAPQAAGVVPGAVVVGVGVAVLVASPQTVSPYTLFGIAVLVAVAARPRIIQSTLKVRRIDGTFEERQIVIEVDSWTL